jgi:hypothetical protein
LAEIFEVTILPLTTALTGYYALKLGKSPKDSLKNEDFPYRYREGKLVP